MATNATVRQAWVAGGNHGGRRGVDEWEWAFTQIGIPISLDQATRCQARQSCLRTTEFITVERR